MNYDSNKLNIDTRISMYEDTPIGRDPDSYSQTLIKYHFLLWNKEFFLKNIKVNDNSRPYYLNLVIDHSTYKLTSDSIINSYKSWNSVQDIIKEIDEDDVDSFFRLASTIGGYIIFPGYRLNNKPTINAARGINKQIKDRFDLTLECIKLWYEKIDNPLYQSIDIYKDYFNLFKTFKNYIVFFHLEDLVDEALEVKHFLPFKSFIEPYEVVPSNKDFYIEYMKNAKEFIKSRNLRIQKYANEMVNSK